MRVILYKVFQKKVQALVFVGVLNIKYTLQMVCKNYKNLLQRVGQIEQSIPRLVQKIQDFYQFCAFSIKPRNFFICALNKRFSSYDINVYFFNEPSCIFLDIPVYSKLNFLSIYKIWQYCSVLWVTWQPARSTMSPVKMFTSGEQ